MALVEHTLFGEVDRVQSAIDLLRAMEPPEEPYWLAFSGGKDSIVCHQLCIESGVRFVGHFNQAMEPPEVIHFIRKHYPNVIIHRPKPTMWELIAKNRWPPTQNMKYCCGAMKERHGEGLVITGVRKEESNSRKNRRQIEVCRNNIGKRFLHPILEWSVEDVWACIKDRGLPYPSLYDEGRPRIGCVMCPMGNTKQMVEDALRWPKIYEAYLRAFDRVVVKRKEDGLKCDFRDGMDLMKWWIYRPEKEDEDQMGLFE